MCLYTLDDPPKKQSGTGWKVFTTDQLREDVLHPFVRHWQPSHTIGKWEKALARRHIATRDCSDMYVPYFHIFKTRRAAEKYLSGSLWVASPQYVIRKDVIRKVEYRRAVYEGTTYMNNRLYKTVVAREMRIIPDHELIDRALEGRNG